MEETRLSKRLGAKEQATDTPSWDKRTSDSQGQSERVMRGGMEACWRNEEKNCDREEQETCYSSRETRNTIPL
jgi:hypothetical protein